jgi:ribulose-phosphate 3-epimerase
MTVTPGKQGQKLIPQVLDRVTSFKQKYPQIPSQVDGGVNENNLELVLQTGANDVVIGSSIFAQGDPAENFTKFQKKLEEKAWK